MDHVASASSQMQTASASNQSPLSLTKDPNARYFTTLSFRETIDVTKLNKLLLTAKM
jgi:hypothetical protein